MSTRKLEAKQTVMSRRWKDSCLSTDFPFSFVRCSTCGLFVDGCLFVVVFGMTAVALKNAGFGTLELLDAGFSVAELRAAQCSVLPLDGVMVPESSEAISSALAITLVVLRLNQSLQYNHRACLSLGGHSLK